MSSLVFSNHALRQMNERGASKSEVQMTIEKGEPAPAKKGRLAFRYNFQYNSKWSGTWYRIKQVMPVVVRESDHYVVVTVYTFYF